MAEWSSLPDALRSLLIGAVTLYAGLALAAALLSDFLLFPIGPREYSVPGLLELPVEGGKVAAIYLRNPDARLTLLHSHGNGEDLGSILPLLREYNRRGFSVLAYDYPGYGRSTGRASEAGAYAAIDACYRYLKTDQGLTPGAIVLYGRSLGSGPTLDLASRERVGGVILENAFVSAFRVMTRIRLLPWDKFGNERKIGRVDSPILVIQAEQDEVVGYWHGPRLFDAASEPKDFWSVAGAGHNDLLAVAGEEYWRRLQSFSDSVSPN